MKTHLFLFFALSIQFTTPAWGYDFYSESKRKQTVKEAKRWSLSEWLEQKEKVKLMDSWLLFNPPSPYEFFLGVDTSSLNQSLSSPGNPDVEQTYRNYRGSFAAFVSLVGLYGEYEQSDETLKQWKALFLLRLMGTSDQSTNLTLHYGLMNQDLQSDVTQYQVAGARLNFYLIKPFALTGLYEKIFEATSEQGIQGEGYRYEAGVHIEYGALRIYGSWFEESLDLVLPGSTTQLRRRQGILFGTRLYF